MPRKPRVEYEGAVYHVMSRGDRQNLIYRDDRDKKTFLETLTEACSRCGWRIHAFVLMDNHYHLLLETPNANLVDGMKWLLGTYTQRFNSRHKEWGHLFQGRYKALIVDSNGGDYFSTVATYIHLNPARAGLLDSRNPDLSEYRWGSYPFFIQPLKRPLWLCTKRVLEALGFADDDEGRTLYETYLQKRTVEVACSENPAEFDERWKQIRRGWCLGGEEFRREMEGLVDRRVETYDRRSYAGLEVEKHDELAAMRLLEHGLKTCGLQVSELQELRKGDYRKKAIAWLVRNNTSVHNDWICEHLYIGRSSNLSRHVRSVEESTDGELIALREMMKKEV
jgi:REP element-mobilizing transposase RayT